MATPKLELIRFYNGLTRDHVVSVWARALRSGMYRQTSKALHRPSYAPTPRQMHNGGFCVYGVLCHALELPRRVEQTPKGMLFAYADNKDGVFDTEQMPPMLHEFLVPKTSQKLRVDLSKMIVDSPVLFAKILLDTGLTRDQIMLMEPTIARLNDIGVKFGTLSLIIESKHW